MNHFAVHKKLTQHCKSTILQFLKMVDFMLYKSYLNEKKKEKIVFIQMGCVIPTSATSVISLFNESTLK